jgi:hypothetical protein
MCIIILRRKKRSKNPNNTHPNTLGLQCYMQTLKSGHSICHCMCKTEILEFAINCTK